ncbi:MAG: CAP domain-containing protein [Desulfomonile tiedjei]|nr:CAP domain-containing protein [Desulfomonile tiedjei]
MTVKVKIFLILALGILCTGNYTPAKEQGNQFEKKHKKEATNSAAKEPILTMQREVLRYTNEERRQRKLAPLMMGSGLQFLASTHSANMCELRKLQHESDKFPEGWQKFAGRLKIVGVTSGGENIAFRTVAAEPRLWAREIVKGWMNSAQHRKNILDPRFTYVGIGVTPCANRIVYAAQVFSTEPGRVPHTRE